MTEKHTPTPWEARLHNNGSHWFIDADSGEGDGTGITVVDELSEANAAYIVKACNGYEELLAAAKASRTEIEALVADGTLTADGVETNAGWIQLCEAIANAEEAKT